MEDAGQQTFLYRYFDAEGVLLYVGITSDIETRGSDHARSSKWHYLSKSRTVEEFGTREEALAAECTAIEAENPKFNVQAGVKRLGQRQGLPSPPMRGGMEDWQSAARNKIASEVGRQLYVMQLWRSIGYMKEGLQMAIAAGDDADGWDFAEFYFERLRAILQKETVDWPSSLLDWADKLLTNRPKLRNFLDSWGRDLLKAADNAARQEAA